MPTVPQAQSAGHIRAERGRSVAQPPNMPFARARKVPLTSSALRSARGLWNGRGTNARRSDRRRRAVFCRRGGGGPGHRPSYNCRVAQNKSPTSMAWVHRDLSPHFQSRDGTEKCWTRPGQAADPHASHPAVASTHHHNAGGTQAGPFSVQRLPILPPSRRRSRRGQRRDAGLRWSVLYEMLTVKRAFDVD